MGDVKLEGIIAYDPAKLTKASPAVLSFTMDGHHHRLREKPLQTACRAGNVAFAADIYGKGIRPTAMQDAAKQAGIYKKDRELYRKRLKLGLEQLKQQPGVASSKIAAIGYCFGGTGSWNWHAAVLRSAEW